MGEARLNKGFLALANPPKGAEGVAVAECTRLTDMVRLGVSLPHKKHNIY